MTAPDRSLTRRDVLTGAAGGAILNGCGRTLRVTPPQVSIVRASGYTQGIYGVVRRILTEHRLNVRGLKVVLKPNLVEFEPNGCTNTNALLVHAAYEGFLALGAASVRIAEGPGHRRNTLDLADAAGYFRLFPRFEEVFTDLNVDEVTRVPLERKFSRLEKLYLPNTVLGAGLLVSMPKMKTHHWVGATLSMKNLFGIVPGGIYGWPKNVLHWAGINECIADLHAACPRHFTMVDGIVGMEGNGPIQGLPKAVGVVVAGRDMVAVDATCCRIMGIDPFKIGYLKIAAASEMQIAAPGIAQIAELVDSVAAPFALIPEFQGLRLESMS
jgi:uncharacterized protein (DUF362 family)